MFGGEFGTGFAAGILPAGGLRWWQRREIGSEIAHVVGLKRRGDWLHR